MPDHNHAWPLRPVQRTGSILVINKETKKDKAKHKAKEKKCGFCTFLPCPPTQHTHAHTYTHIYGFPVGRHVFIRFNAVKHLNS
jgi:ribosomal protein L36